LLGDGGMAGHGVDGDHRDLKLVRVEQTRERLEFVSLLRAAHLCGADSLCAHLATCRT
jgi:hypothetical protein